MGPSVHRLALPAAAVVLLATPLLASIARADGPIARGKHVRVSLVCEQADIVPGQATTVGLRFEPDPDWHVYWKNPGDAGAAPTIDWTLPPGVTAGPLQWPAPERLAEGPVVTYVYEGPVLLPVTLTAAPAVEARRVEIVADVTWLVCKDECVPGDARLQLSLPVAATSDAPRGMTTEHELFTAARLRLPQPLGAESAELVMRDKALEIRLDGEAVPRKATWEIFPAAWNVLAPDGETAVAASPEGVLLTHLLAPNRDAAPTRFEGVLVATDGDARRAYEIDLEISGSAPVAQDEQKHNPWKTTLAVALLGVFAGATLGLFMRRRQPPAP